MDEKIIHKKCLMCGRPLKTVATQQRGYGYVCWMKHLNIIKNNANLFDIDRLKINKEL